jgi:hypothetical protein
MDDERNALSEFMFLDEVLIDHLRQRSGQQTI